MYDLFKFFCPFFCMYTATPSNSGNPMTPPSTVVPPFPPINPQDQANFSGTLTIGAVSAPNGGSIIPANGVVGAPQRMAANPGVFQFRQFKIQALRSNAGLVYVGGDSGVRFTLGIPTAVPTNEVAFEYTLPPQADPTKVYDLWDLWIQTNTNGDGVAWEGWS